MKFIKVFFVFTLGFLLYSCGKSDGLAPSLADFAPLVAPGVPVITSPSILSAITKTSLVITGQCESSATVFVTGDSSQSTTCAASIFSFTITKATSGLYFLKINQSNSVGASAKVTVAWTFDNIVPFQISITSPLANPYVSGGSTISISGTCETGTTVNITGDHTATKSCVSSAFIFTGITKSIDGSYVFNLTQTDLATNVSAVRTFTWIRDTSIPATPTITNFIDNPHYSKTSPLTVSGACTGGGNQHTVYIAEAGVILGSQLCAVGNTYSINIPKGSNGNYSLEVYQNDPVSTNDSANLNFIWVYDSVAPLAPVISNPTVSPITTSGILTIAGTCEVNATVNLTGDDIQSKICTSGSFSFSISEATDATYNYTLTQTDLALNTSASTSQQWIKDSTVLALPTIDTPSVNPFISNSVNLILSGQCQDGLTVVLSGVLASDVIDPSNSLTTTCVNSVYSFTMTKADGGPYLLSIYQKNGTLSSANVSQSWTKDTVEPNTTLSSTPPATNYSTQAIYVFSANETSSFECSLDSLPYQTCTSPAVFTNLANTTHTMDIRAIDLANNIESTPAHYSWVHTAYKTIALFHLNAAAPMIDSGPYTGGASNTLTDNASANLPSAVFVEGRTMSTTSNYASVADTVSMQAISSYLTLEAWMKFNALPGSNSLLPIISKNSGGLASFEYGIKKQGAKYYIYFLGSLNGTSTTEKRSSSLSAGEITALAAGFNHIAVTWNLGSISFYLNGNKKGTGAIGTVGSAKLANSAAPMRLGYSGATNTSLNGSLDEVRVSQELRWTNGFTPPASAYIAD